MPLSTFLKSATGTCPFCNQRAGILSREQPECRRTFQAGWNKMVHLPTVGGKFQQSDNLAQM